MVSLPLSFPFKLHHICDCARASYRERVLRNQDATICQKRTKIKNEARVLLYLTYCFYLLKSNFIVIYINKVEFCVKNYAL